MHFSFKNQGSGVPKYKDEAKELVRPERNTLEVVAIRSYFTYVAICGLSHDGLEFFCFC